MRNSTRCLRGNSSAVNSIDSQHGLHTLRCTKSNFKGRRNRTKTIVKNYIFVFFIYDLKQRRKTTGSKSQHDFIVRMMYTDNDFYPVFCIMLLYRLRFVNRFIIDFDYFDNDGDDEV